MPRTEIYMKAYTRDHKEENVIYTPEPGSNDVKITVSNSKRFTTIKFRNVGEGNPDAAIQFSVSEYNRDTNRTKHLSFSIPQQLAHLFIAHLQNKSFEDA